jgi:tRNA/tmRNA/rRNA uracil-C5-methylase (TrmA/RlmC/RlmD family)
MLAPGCNPECHGCRHRGWEVARSEAQKRQYLARVLTPWAERLGAPALPRDSRRLGYRDRATLSARWRAGQGWQFGLVRREVLIPIPDCPVHTGRIRGLVHLLMDHLPPVEEFPLAFLHVAAAQATLVVKTRTAATAWLDALAPLLPPLAVEGLWVNWHPAAGRRLFAKRGWQLLWGKPRSRDATGFWHGPAAFQQLLPELYREAVRTATDFLAPDADSRVLDLCCGTGQTLAAWTGAGAAALGVDLAAEAIECARLNAPEADLLQGTCSARLPQIRQWWQAAGHRRLAWLNPPRSGLEPEVATALAGELRPCRLAYLSCSAGTLARDLRVFADAGYRVRVLLPFDFFPQTHHVEVLALAELPLQ